MSLNESPALLVNKAGKGTTISPEMQATEITSEPFLSSKDPGNQHVLSPRLILELSKQSF